MSNPEHKNRIPNLNGVLPNPEKTVVVGGVEITNIVVGGDSLLRRRHEELKRAQDKEFETYLEANMTVAAQNIDRLVEK